MSRLKDQYKDEIIDAMMKKFNYKNKLEVPKLEKIVIPASLREAGEYAFSHTGVKSVTIPEGAALTTLESCLFFQCFDLEEVILPASIRFINDGAFKECSPKLTIKAPAGSCGEAYAKDNGITFEELSR